jgi:hypothetical protein
MIFRIVGVVRRDWNARLKRAPRQSIVAVVRM